MAFEQLARELLKLLRGRRSQRGLSRRLGYDSNVMYRWESGRSWPSAEAFFHLVDVVRPSSQRAVQEFLQEPLTLDPRISLRDTAGVVRFLERLRGDAQVNDIAERVGCSRFTVSRWLSGSTHVRLPELLAYIEVTTLRLLDFLRTLVDPLNLPSVKERWQLLEASRRAAYEHPWSHAVMRCLETDAYQRLKRHRRGFVAKRIGITVQEEETCLEILRQAGQIRLYRGRFVVSETQTIDTRSRADQAANLKGFWLDVVRARHREQKPGTYAFNLFSISEADFERLRQMHHAFFADMRRVIAASEPPERVVLLATQLIALDSVDVQAERNPNPRRP